MARLKIKSLITILDKELAKAKLNAIRTKKSADEIARSAAASPSQSGDREHSRQQAIINADRLERLVELKNLLVKFIDIHPESIRPPCFVKLDFEFGEEQEFYLVDRVLFLPKVGLLSASAVLGESLLGLCVGDKFKFVIDSKEVSGKILELG